MAARARLYVKSMCRRDSAARARAERLATCKHELSAGAISTHAGRAKDGQDPRPITFEQGYERLKEIAARIDEEEVPVSELCELFAEGKGLERALSEYLESQQGRLEEIERGEGV